MSEPTDCEQQGKQEQESHGDGSNSDTESELLYPILEFRSDKSFDESKIVRKDLLPDGKALVLYGVFTPEECHHLIEQGETFGFGDLPETAHYRTNKRIIMRSEEFTETLWSRVRPHVEETVSVGPKQETFHTSYLATGTWKAEGLNPVTRLCKYNPENFFRAHYDEGYHPDLGEVRTMKTCMVYLNSEFTGGETVFYFDKDSEPLKLKPETGMCLIFNQKIWHEGATVTSGLKYFARTDIFYRKISAWDFGSELSENQIRALEAYERAMQFETEKRWDECTKLYSRAWRYDIDVEKVYYQLFIGEP